LSDERVWGASHRARRRPTFGPAAQRGAFQETESAMNILSTLLAALSSVFGPILQFLQTIFGSITGIFGA